MNKLLPIAVACCLCVTCLTETQPPVMTNQFVGLWKLVRIETRRANGTITADPDLDPNAIGYICYDPSGHMSVQIMNPDNES
jgi:Lipocalin-like domain